MAKAGPPPRRRRRRRTQRHTVLPNKDPHYIILACNAIFGYEHGGSSARNNSHLFRPIGGANILKLIVPEKESAIRDLTIKRHYISEKDYIVAVKKSCPHSKCTRSLVLNL